MRKLLINTTALVTVAGLTAGVALADGPTVKATSEMNWISKDSTVATAKGDYTTNASEVVFSFSNKTDSGLTVSYNAELTTNTGDNTTNQIDESYLTISGGFGKVVLGQTDDAADSYAIDSGDLVAEELNVLANATINSATISTTADMALNNDDSKIAYHIPAMGGFTAGVSKEDNGTANAANTETDIISIGARYSMDLGGLPVTIGAGQTKADTAVGTKQTTSTNVGVKAVYGNISAIIARGGYVAEDENRSSNGIAVSYKMDNGLTLAVYKTDSADSDDINEKYKNTGMEAQYLIASGLTAVINHETFDYDAGTSDETSSDDGSVTKFTIKAAF